MSHASHRALVVDNQVAIARLSAAEFHEKLGRVSQVLPISAAALDVYQMTQSLEWDLSQIAAAVQRDASLATEVLRMANSRTTTRRAGPSWDWTRR